MTASITEDRCFEDRRAGGFEGLRIEWMAAFLNLYLHLDTRTWDLVAETWDLKVF